MIAVSPGRCFFLGALCSFLCVPVAPSSAQQPPSPRPFPQPARPAPANPPAPTTPAPRAPSAAGHGAAVIQGSDGLSRRDEDPRRPRNLFVSDFDSCPSWFFVTS